ncbi:YaeQ family protein [Rosenbergiella australiborealis]|uniref:YaeQ family protein n=1 Tax=Rosenbergiella australiborealis TaxID=1544696 RepID=A0ABS5T1Q6_9GAMM|nr:YaeQ family protein [Rosenbergiella australiborealis]MBT0726263.1 YaeQ family protein [Rosenbergiella australiborealis]
MALKATIFKAVIDISDLDRHYYANHTLTLARHPSENDERMMLRLFAWCHYASERLLFTRGLSSDEEPEIWQHHDHGSPELWIELGLPDERRLKKAASQASEVVLFTYQSRAAAVWKQQTLPKLAALRNLTIWHANDEQLAQLAALAQRSMALQITLQEGVVWLSDGVHNVEIELELWQKTT